MWAAIFKVLKRTTLHESQKLKLLFTIENAATAGKKIHLLNTN